SFLLNVHFCNSRFPNLWPHCCRCRQRRRGRTFDCLTGGTDMTMLQDRTGELASRSELNSAAPLLLLATDEARAPTVILSPAKLAALTACLHGGGILHKRSGVWNASSASAGDKPI